MVRAELNSSLTIAGCRGCTTGAPAPGRKDWAPASSCSGLSEKMVLWLGCKVFSIVHMVPGRGAVWKGYGTFRSQSLNRRSMSLGADLEV